MAGIVCRSMSPWVVNIYDLPRELEGALIDFITSKGRRHIGKSESLPDAGLTEQLRRPHAIIWAIDANHRAGEGFVCASSDLGGRFPHLNQ